MGDESDNFAVWLNATMQSRRLSQADMARAVGVADAQVSRWRRGQVVPTVRYLQRIADTFGVPRATLDRLAGYPVEETTDDEGADHELKAELQAHGAWYADLMERKLPRSAWRAYAQACESLADALAESFREAMEEVPGGTKSGVPESPDDPVVTPSRRVGFRP